MIAVNRQFKLIILANVVLLSLYIFFNWAEYSIISINSFLDDVTIQTVFPFYFLVTRFSVGFSAIFFLNYPLIIFATATIVNLHFIFKLQRRLETKPDT